MANRLRVVALLLFILTSVLTGQPVRVEAQAQPSVREDVYPIDLATALRLAGSQSLRIAEAEAQVREASGVQWSAYERFLPSLSGEWFFAKHEGRIQATEGDIFDVTKQSNRIGGHLAATWDLNEALFTLLAARRSYSASTHALDRITDSALLVVAHAYFDLVEADAQARIANRAVSLSADLVAQTERGVGEGVGLQLDVLRARTQLAHDRLTLHQARESRLTASALLARVLNLEEPVSVQPFDTSLAVLPLVDTAEGLNRWLSEASELNPAIRSRAAARAAARWGKRQAIWGPLLPEVEGHAFLGNFGLKLSLLDRSRDYTISARWNLGPGGLLDFGRIRTLSSRESISRIRLEATTRLVMESVKRGFAQLSERGAMLTTAGDGLRFADRAYELASQRRELGVAMVLEVIDAAEALMRAETDYARAIIEYNRAQVETLAVLGRLTGGFGTTLSPHR